MELNVNADQFVITAKFNKVIYEDESNGFCIYLCDVVTDGSEMDGTEQTSSFRIKGHHLPSVKDVYYQYTGKWEKSKYGNVFAVDMFDMLLPSSKNHIIEFLASPLIPQVGVRTAEKIYDEFREQTFYVIENDYLKLTEVKGIKEQKALRIHNGFIESKAINIIYSMLGNAFSFTHAIKLYSDYKNLQKITDIITKTPYKLIHYRGVTFQMVDQLAKRVINNPEDPGRIVVAGQYILDEYSVYGNVGMPIGAFFRGVMELLHGSKSAYDQPVTKALVKRIIGKYSVSDCSSVKKGVAFIYQNKIIFKAKNAIVEQYISSKLKQLMAYSEVEQKNEFSIKTPSGENVMYSLDELIEIYEDQFQFTLDESQKNAVKLCFQSGVAIVTGGPGTGKSTIMKAVLYIQRFIDPHSELTLLAPTGRAAKRLSDATGVHASTIHSALHIIPNESDTNVDMDCTETDVELESDVVIVDEMSMSDMAVMHALCKSISIGARLIMIGDENQLPSVGPGNVLHDLIHSGVVPTVKLQKIFRQSDGSSIIENASKINDGATNLTFDKDFRFIRVKNSDVYTEEVGNKKLQHSIAVDKIVDLYNRAVCKYGIDDVVLLVPHRRRGFLSVNNLNPIIQRVINKEQLSGPFAKYGDLRFYRNDRVMQTKNIKIEDEEGQVIYISNGDIGYIRDIYTTKDEDDGKEETRMIIDFDGQAVEYTKEMMQALDLAYCQTVHKGQGAEYRIVLFGLMNEHVRMLKKKILYTGVTRGKEFVCLVGETDALKTAILDSGNDEQRVTLLCERLQGQLT